MYTQPLLWSFRSIQITFLKISFHFHIPVLTGFKQKARCWSAVSAFFWHYPLGNCMQEISWNRSFLIQITKSVKWLPEIPVHGWFSPRQKVLSVLSFKLAVLGHGVEKVFTGGMLVSWGQTALQRGQMQHSVAHPVILQVHCFIFA